MRSSLSESRGDLAQSFLTEWGIPHNVRNILTGGTKCRVWGGQIPLGLALHKNIDFCYGKYHLLSEGYETTSGLTFYFIPLFTKHNTGQTSLTGYLKLASSPPLGPWSQMSSSGAFWTYHWCLSGVWWWWVRDDSAVFKDDSSQYNWMPLNAVCWSS